MRQTYLSNAPKVVRKLIKDGYIITNMTKTGKKERPRVKIYYSKPLAGVENILAGLLY